MLVFNEGVPRAGKSYDAVKNHILPALKAGRMVFARINGLDHAAIARHLKMPEQRVRDLLVEVQSDDVHRTFAAYKDESQGGRWAIPDKLKNSLAVIDEVHEFYVAQRQPLPDEQENFFALIGQNGGDVVIMTQWIKRVHAAVRARIERKNVFQKLTAVGAKNKYRVTYYQTLGPDKFEKIGGATETYDPAIYPLYHGYAPGADNVEVYDGGGTNVWKMLSGKLVLWGIVGVFAVGTLLWFFGGGGASGLVSGKEQTIGGTREATGDPAAYYLGARDRDERGIIETDEQRRKREGAERLARMTPEQRYVVALGEQGRIRLAVRMLTRGVERVMVEWLDDAGRPLERLSGEQLAAMGVTVQAHAFGVTLDAGEERMVATQWPLTMVIREQESRLYRLDDGDGAPALTPSASEPSAMGARSGWGEPGAVPAYGGFRG